MQHRLAIAREANRRRGEDRLSAGGDAVDMRKARKRGIELEAEHDAVRQHVVVADLQSPEVASRPVEDVGGPIEVERAREIGWRAPVRMSPGIAEMSAHIEAGPIVGLDHGGLPRRLYRHRHFRRHGRSSSQKCRRPCHASQLRDGRTADDSETLNATSHGGRPLPLDSSPLSPQRKTAPCARPARRKDDLFRQVSWLAGHDPSPPSQALSHKAQWQTEEGLAADSCGGSSGFDSPPKRRIAPDSLLGRSTRLAHLNARDGRRRRRFCQRPKFISP